MKILIEVLNRLLAWIKADSLEAILAAHQNTINRLGAHAEAALEKSRKAESAAAVHLKAAVEQKVLANKADGIRAKLESLIQ